MSAVGPTGPPGPSLTVIALVHRRLDYLAEALDSALAQSDPEAPPELLLVGPRRPPILDEPRFRPVRFVASAEPGVAGKISDGLREAHGDLVAFLEDDDRYAAGRIHDAVRLFRERPALGYLQNGYRPIGPDGAPAPGRGPHPRRRERWIRRGPVELRGPRTRRALTVLGGIPAGFNLSSMTIRRSLLDGIDGWLRRMGMLADSALLYAALASPFDLRLTPEPWTELRVHAHSHSDPAGDDGPESMAQRRAFLEGLRPARRVLRERVAGVPALDRALDGQVASEEVIRLLRDPSAARPEMAAAVIATLSRWETFEVAQRRGAIPLGLLATVSPGLGHRLYRIARGWP
ncbi:MAG: glycosyltransferase [Thermoplasmata archaeon]